TYTLQSCSRPDPHSENEFAAARLTLRDGSTNTFADVAGLFAIGECEQEEQGDENSRVGRAKFPCNREVVRFQDAKRDEHRAERSVAVVLFGKEVDLRVRSAGLDEVLVLGEL